MTEYEDPRHHIVDNKGKPFRGNGFRRVKKITPKRGEWMLKHQNTIELGKHSIWWWCRKKMN